MAEGSVRDSEGAGISGSEIARCNCSKQYGSTRLRTFND